MADLEYKIKIASDDSGATQAKAEVTSLAAAANKAAAEEAAATEGLNVKKKDLLGNLKQLKHEIPEVGRLMALVKNPMVAVGVAIGSGIQLLHRWSEATQQAALQAQQISGLIQPFKSTGEAADIAAGHANEFAEALRQIARGGSGAAEALQALINKEQEFNKAQDEEQSAEQRLEKTKVNLSLARGKLTPAEAEVQLAGIDVKYDRLARANALARQDRAIALQQHAGAGTMTEISLAMADKADLDAHVGSLSTREEKRAEMLKGAEAVRTDRLAAIAKRREEITRLQTGFGPAAGWPGVRRFEDAPERLDAEMASLDSEEGSIMGARRSDAGAIRRGKSELDTAVKAQGSVEARIQGLQTQFRQIKTAIEGMQSQRAIAGQADRIIGPMNEAAIYGEAATRLFQGSRAAGDQATGLRHEIYGRSERGQSFDEVAQRLSEVLRAQDDFASKAIKILNAHSDQLEGHTNQMRNPQ